MLKGERHENNSVIPLEELGHDNDALLAITGNQGCCRDRRIGEFFYPDGSLVPINNAGQALYRNRDNQLIRLHLRDQASSVSTPRGKYHCELPDDCGEMVSLYVNLGKLVMAENHWCSVTSKYKIGLKSVLNTTEVSIAHLGVPTIKFHVSTFFLQFKSFKSRRRTSAG